jgi:hypothetical protein
MSPSHAALRGQWPRRAAPSPRPGRAGDRAGTVTRSRTARSRSRTVTAWRRVRQTQPEPARPVRVTLPVSGTPRRDPGRDWHAAARGQAPGPGRPGPRPRPTGPPGAPAATNPHSAPPPTATGPLSARRSRCKASALPAPGPPIACDLRVCGRSGAIRQYRAGTIF